MEAQVSDTTGTEVEEPRVYSIPAERIEWLEKKVAGLVMAAEDA